MDKRVKTIRPNYFKVDPTEFLKDNRSNVDKYKYVSDHYIMLGLEPTFKEGDTKATIMGAYVCPRVCALHCYRATKEKIYSKGQANLGTTDIELETVKIELVS